MRDALACAVAIALEPAGTGRVCRHLLHRLRAVASASAGRDEHEDRISLRGRSPASRSLDVSNITSVDKSRNQFCADDLARLRLGWPLGIPAPNTGVRRDGSA